MDNRQRIAHNVRTLVAVRPYRKAGLLPAVMICVGAFSLAGCTPISTGGGAQSPDCEPIHKYRLDLRASTQDEEKYINDTIVCATPDLSEATLTNNTGVVFSFTGGLVKPVANTLRYELFREGARTYTANSKLFALPGETVLLQRDGDKALSSIAWQLDPTLTSVWLVQEGILGKVKAVSQTAVAERFAAGSSPRRAVAACAFTLGPTAKAVSDLESGSNSYFDVFNLAAAASPCVTAWNKARAEVGNKSFPSLSNGVQKAGSVLETAGLFKSAFAKMSSVGSIFRAALH